MQAAEVLKRGKASIKKHHDYFNVRDDVLNTQKAGERAASIPWTNKRKRVVKFQRSRLPFFVTDINLT